MCCFAYYVYVMECDNQFFPEVQIVFGNILKEKQNIVLKNS
jgi:hypothetical protein